MNRRRRWQTNRSGRTKEISVKGSSFPPIADKNHIDDKHFLEKISKNISLILNYKLLKSTDSLTFQEINALKKK